MRIPPRPAPPALARRSRAFTLIELLTVIAIIGILAAIVIPTVGSVREKAQRSVDGNNIREILKAAIIYASDNQDKLPDPQTITTTQLTGGNPVFRWPGILAKNTGLVDPAFYLAKNDPLAPATAPTVILTAGVAARNQIDTTFTSSTLSWEFVGGVKMSDAATTPVIYTRGLQQNGTWNGTTGATTIAVYKDLGGYVAFLGGNVGFYPNTGANAAAGLFTSNGPGRTKTNNILQAVPFATAAANRARIYGVNATIGTPAGVTSTQGP